MICTEKAASMIRSRAEMPEASELGYDLVLFVLWADRRYNGTAGPMVFGDDASKISDDMEKIDIGNNKYAYVLIQKEYIDNYHNPILDFIDGNLEVIESNAK